MRCVRVEQEHPWTITHLKRSKHCMVALVLDAFRHLYPHELRTIFEPHGHRIRCLKIKGINYHLTPMLWRQLTGLMPFLEEYDYVVPHDITLRLRRDEPKAPRPFPFPPVHRTNFYITWSLWNTSGLTSLVLRYVGEQDKIRLQALHEMLLQCRLTLRRFEWVGLAPIVDPDRHIPNIHLPAMEALNIGYLDDVVPLLNLLDVPNLKSLTLRDILLTPDLDRTHVLPEVLGDTDMKYIFHFFQRNQLTDFALFGEVHCQIDEFRQFLLNMKSLETLTLYCCADEYCVALFDPDISPDAMVPSLKRLLITPIGYTGSLVLFLQDRIRTGLLPLRQLTMTTDGMTVIQEEGLLPELMKGAVSISTVTDPWPTEYTVFHESERDVVLDGVVVSE